MQTYTTVFVFFLFQVALNIKIKAGSKLNLKGKLRSQVKKWELLNPFHSQRFSQSKVLTNTKQEGILKEGFIRLASDNFANIVNFPNIPQEKGKADQSMQLMTRKELSELQIVLEKNGNFRKNTQKSVDENIPTLDSFYFRLTAEAFYYTETATDSNILGSIQLKNLKTTLPYTKKGCFKITDTENDDWMICSTDGSCPKEWKDAIMTAIGKTNNDQCPEDNPQQDLFIDPQIIQPVAAPDCKYDWNYNFHGQNWVCHCNEGLEQSPLDLPAAQSLHTVSFNAKFNYIYIDGQNIQVIYETNLLRFRTNEGYAFGSLTDTDGQEYEAYEIQFHTPGEHQINGLQIDMEVQVVHRAIDGDVKKQAILSFLFKRVPGTVKTVWDTIDLLNLPNPINNIGVDIIKSRFNVYNFLFDEENEIEQNRDFGYYKYQGSRTQPPCEEFVTWFVVSEPIPCSSTIITIIRDSLSAPGSIADNTRLNFDGSNRMVQKQGSRKIYYFDPLQACFGDFKQESQQQQTPEGHFEIVTKQVQKYMSVDGFEPSGIKGAVVVGKEEADNLEEAQSRITDRYEIHI